MIFHKNRTKITSIIFAGRNILEVCSCDYISKLHLIIKFISLFLYVHDFRAIFNHLSKFQLVLNKILEQI